MNSFIRTAALALAVSAVLLPAGCVPAYETGPAPETPEALAALCAKHLPNASGILLLPAYRRNSFFYSDSSPSADQVVLELSDPQVLAAGEAPETPDGGRAWGLVSVSWALGPYRKLERIWLVAADGRIGYLEPVRDASEQTVWRWHESPRADLTELTALLRLCRGRTDEDADLSGALFPRGDFRNVRVAFTPEELTRVLELLEKVPPVR